MAESKSKVQFCEEASGNLENLLSELQLQHDNARSHIIEAFQSYKVRGLTRITGCDCE